VSRSSRWGVLKRRVSGAERLPLLPATVRHLRDAVLKGSHWRLPELTALRVMISRVSVRYFRACVEWC
jgi:hypothetical protein